MVGSRDDSKAIWLWWRAKGRRVQAISKGSQDTQYVWHHNRLFRRSNKIVNTLLTESEVRGVWGELSRDQLEFFSNTDLKEKVCPLN